MGLRRTPDTVGVRLCGARDSGQAWTWSQYASSRVLPLISDSQSIGKPAKCHQQRLLGSSCSLRKKCQGLEPSTDLFSQLLLIHLQTNAASVQRALCWQHNPTHPELQSKQSQVHCRAAVGGQRAGTAYPWAEERKRFSWISVLYGRLYGETKVFLVWRVWRRSSSWEVGAKRQRRHRTKSRPRSTPGEARGALQHRERKATAAQLAGLPPKPPNGAPVLRQRKQRRRAGIGLGRASGSRPRVTRHG